MESSNLFNQIAHLSIVCLISETREEQLAVVIPFIKIGLERGEQCVYIADDNSVDNVVEAMRKQDIDVKKYQKTGTLQVLTKQDAYLKEGTFNPEQMIQFLTEKTAQAKKAGFTALRATGEMTWVTDSNTGSERLFEYEAKLYRFFQKNDCLAMFQYDRNRFSASLIRDVIRTHPLVIYDSHVHKNPYYVPPEEFLKPDAASLEVERLLTSLKHQTQTEHRLNRMTRAYQTISQCNQMLVRAEKEQDLLQHICDTIVETGGYRMAWIGFKQQDRKKSVTPVAQAGFEAGYLDKLNIVWSNTKRGQGPTGTAIRTGEAVIARDIRTDARFVSWQNEALKRGYASLIALPLIIGDNCLGALNIYAEKPDAFDAEEVTLLKELADDLSYGLAALRTRIAHIESEMRYRQLFEEAPMACFSVHTDGHINMANHEAVTLTGYARKQLIGMPVLELYADTPAGKDHAKQVFARFRTGHEIRGAELQMRRADNELRWINLTVRLIRNASGHVTHSLSMVMDITEHKQKDEALRKSEQLLNETQKITKAGGWEYDVQKQKLAWTDQVYRIYGVDRKEYDPNNVEQDIAYYAPEDRKKLEQAFFNAVNKGEPYDLELGFISAKGEHLWVRTIGNPVLQDGKVVKVVGDIVDITERKQAEEVIKESENKYRMLFESANDAIFVMQGERFVDCNSFT